MQDFKTEVGRHFRSKKPANRLSFRHLGMVPSCNCFHISHIFLICMSLHVFACLCCKRGDPGAEAPKQSLSKSDKVSAGRVKGYKIHIFVEQTFSVQFGEVRRFLAVGIPRSSSMFPFNFHVLKHETENWAPPSGQAYGFDEIEALSRYCGAANSQVKRHSKDIHIQ